MATITTFSFLILLAAVSTLLAPSSAQTQPRTFYNCSSFGFPFTAAITVIDVSPDPVVAGGSLTVNIAGQTASGALAVSTKIIVDISSVFGVGPFFWDRQNVYPDGTSPPTDPNFSIRYHTDNLPVTLIPGSGYRLKVSLTDESGYVLICVTTNLIVRLAR